jgi:hypothetical protein
MMTSVNQIFQCPDCKRFFDAQGQRLALSFSEMAAAVREERLAEHGCGAADCGAVAAGLRERELAACRRAARGEGRGAIGRKSDGRGQSGTDKRRVSCARAVVALPYSTRNEEDNRRPEVGGQRAEGGEAPRAAVDGDSVTTARVMGQAGFVASGAADKSNLAIIEFFEKPENFGLWFPAKMLVNVVMKQQSMHMNNRAVDVRPHFLRKGLYLDNFMISPNEFAGKVSCYRVCRLEEALCLSNEQKAALAEEYGVRMETQEHK